MSSSVAVVIPNWNGEKLLKKCLDSLISQSYRNMEIIVVDNGSIDNSLELLKAYKNHITVLPQEVNLGFAGGVNRGIEHALDLGVNYIALLNNDAFADKVWLESLVRAMDLEENIGIATSKILIEGTNMIDTTGDWFTTTGMPFPRGNGEQDTGQYDTLTEVFGGSGGASIYRAGLFKDIGLFDEDFFAYYEDVDISFRAQLRGWAVRFNPSAIVYHKHSATSRKIPGFTIKQSARNFWLLYAKNLPLPLFIAYLPGSIYRYSRMMAASVVKGGGSHFLIGFLHSLPLLVKKIPERYRIQKARKITPRELNKIIYKGKPPLPPDNTSFASLK